MIAAVCALPLGALRGHGQVGGPGSRVGQVPLQYGLFVVVQAVYPLVVVFGGGGGVARGGVVDDVDDLVQALPFVVVAVAYPRRKLNLKVA